MSDFGMTEMGEYHDPSLRLERPTVETQQARQHRIVSHLTQQIIGECAYKPDMEWEMWHQTRRLEDENALPDGVTADDLFQHYLRVYEGE